MSERLAPCPSCSRHVRVSAPRCPFCAREFTRTLMPAPARAGRRYVGKTATALYLTALTTAGCGAKSGLLVPEVDDVATDDRGDVLEFDGFVLDSGVDARPDFGIDSASDVADTGGSTPIYK
ncbi:MAG: hypothetical protein JNL79_15200 [Myxococcales bacterium]|nr:hypothetical protein [Myxococcales bacterium]